MYLLEEQYKDSVTSILEAEKAPAIESDYRKAVTGKLIENTMKSLSESAVQANVTADGESPIANYDPVLISMVRRAIPKLMAFDIAGVQPMTLPTGLIFCIRSRYTSQTGAEAQFDNPANTAFSGAGTTNIGDTAGFAADTFDTATKPDETTTAGTAMATTAGEILGTTGNPAFAEMAFSIEQTNVNAGTRALKAEFSRELQHDLKAVHGLDAETELGNILSTEITAEMDREILLRHNISATHGCQQTGLAQAGSFDVAGDTDGRYWAERVKMISFQIELECNAIAIATRRGRGNYVITSPNVASALAMVGVLTNTPNWKTDLNVDVTQSTFAGMLNGRIKVYIDPYATTDYVSVGYKGTNAWDAGIYYCPYVPLELMRAVGEDSFQPKIGMKTRYGVVANPFATISGGNVGGQTGLGQAENPYFRKFRVTSVLGDLSGSA